MTEARIKVINKELVEFEALISHNLGLNNYRLTMFDPPVEVEHGRHHDDSVRLTQGEYVHEVEPGDLTNFGLDGRIIEIAHQDETVRFKP